MMAAFACQKCNAPLRVDESMRNLNPASFDLLTGSATDQKIQDVTRVSNSAAPERRLAYENARKISSKALFQQGSPSARRGITPGPFQAGDRNRPDMSFVVLTESQLHTPPNVSSAAQKATKSSKTQASSNVTAQSLSDAALSHKLESFNRLFEILSARSDIDYPICSECSELLLQQFQARLTAATKERETFTSYLKDLKTKAPTAEEVTRAKEELETAKADEEAAFNDLVRKEAEKESLEREVAELREEELRLEKEEQSFWKSRNSFGQEIGNLQRIRDAQAAAYSHDEDQLARLRKTNVFNDTFSVGHDGSFGTINGLRLGRLPPNHYVEWAEINAAWGLAALLLTTVAEKLGFIFQGYKIRPMGSTTRIDRAEKVSASDGKPKITSMDLFSSGDLPIARGIVHRRFNDAMVAFLDCMSQLEQFIIGRSNGTNSFALMYTIEKDAINGVSIRLGQSNDVQWTHACKYMLTNCKLLLAHTSSVEAARGTS